MPSCSHSHALLASSLSACEVAEQCRAQQSFISSRCYWDDRYVNTVGTNAHGLEPSWSNEGAHLTPMRTRLSRMVTIMSPSTKGLHVGTYSRSKYMWQGRPSLTTCRSAHVRFPGRPFRVCGKQAVQARVVHAKTSKIKHLFPHRRGVRACTQ